MSNTSCWLIRADVRTILPLIKKKGWVLQHILIHSARLHTLFGGGQEWTRFFVHEPHVKKTNWGQDLDFGCSCVLVRAKPLDSVFWSYVERIDFCIFLPLSVVVWERSVGQPWMHLLIPLPRHLQGRHHIQGVKSPVWSHLIQHTAQHSIGEGGESMEVQATSRGTGAVMHRNPAPSLPAGEVVTCRFPWVNKYFVIKAESKHLTDG